MKIRSVKLGSSLLCVALALGGLAMAAPPKEKEEKTPKPKLTGQEKLLARIHKFMTVEFDKFEGGTKVHWLDKAKYSNVFKEDKGPLSLNGGVQLQLILEGVNPKVGEAPEKLTFAFRSFSQGGESMISTHKVKGVFQQVDKIIFLCGEDRLVFEQADFLITRKEGETFLVGNNMWEFLSIQVPIAFVAKMIEKGSADVRVGKWEFGLEEPQILAVSECVKALATGGL